MMINDSQRALVYGAVVVSILVGGLGCGNGGSSSDQAVSSAPAVNGMAFESASPTTQKSKTENDSAKAASPAVDSAVGRSGMGGSSPTGTVTLKGTPGFHTASYEQAIQISSRKVIRKADLDIRVENVEKAEKKVSEFVQAVGGYTENASSTDLASDHPVMNISLRVPVETFDATISRFETLGVRLSKKIGSEDVTGRIVDLDAQLKTLTAQEEVYRNMLKGRTQLEEVFNIQAQLTTVRTQIEEITSQRKTQAGLAAMSTISLTLEQNSVISATPSDPNWMVQSWAGATSGASSALRLVSVVLMWIVAFSPFWIPALLVLRRVLRGALQPKDPMSPRQI